MTVRINALKAHLTTMFVSDARALDAARDLDRNGPTQDVWLDRREVTFVAALVPYAVHVWSLKNSPFYCFAAADDKVNSDAREILTHPPKPVTNADKLATLLESWGVDEETMARDTLFDSTSPGICMNPECDYTTDVEPDCGGGWCEECKTQTVKSGGLLAGFI